MIQKANSITHGKANTVTHEELKVVADLTVELTRLRMKECKNLCVENFAAELFGKLLFEHQKPSVAPVFITDGHAVLQRKYNVIVALTAETGSGAMDYQEFFKSVVDVVR